MKERVYMATLFNTKAVGLCILAMGLVSFSMGRVGPVSQYGQLQAGKNAAGEGRIYGACKGVSSGAEVTVQGLSLALANAPGDAGQVYWDRALVGSLVRKQNIQVIRAPMAVESNGKGTSNYFSNTDLYQKQMDSVVTAAIANDIYVIIDFHSHCAERQTREAQSFFTYMAQKWGAYDHVIFEIYNEPQNNCSAGWFNLDGAKKYWSEKILPYANTIVSTIREYSDNLIVVGTPHYDQYPNAVLASPIKDDNVAYSFHYYTGEDENRHKLGEEGNNAVNAMKNGLSVFVTEWSNSALGKDGGFNANYSKDWYNWMRKYQLSGVNWAVSNKNETSSYFKGGTWNYSESGNWVNQNVFAGLPKSYTSCYASPDVPALNIASSSSEEFVDFQYSSNSMPSSSASNGVHVAMKRASGTVTFGDLTVTQDRPVRSMNSARSGSNGGTTHIATDNSQTMSLFIANRKLIISGVDQAFVDVLDVQGSPVISYQRVKNSINLDELKQGSYILRVRSGSNTQIRNITIK